MDYVKCEAMQKAYERVGSKQAEKERQIAVREELRDEFCGGPQTTGWWLYKCDDGRKVVQDQDRCWSELAKRQEPVDKRLAKIKADYEAEGCY